jgi:hypothetical protein
MGCHLKRTAQRKFDIFKFGQLSAQEKGKKRKTGFFFRCQLSGCQQQAHSKWVSLSLTITIIFSYLTSGHLDLKRPMTQINVTVLRLRNWA